MILTASYGDGHLQVSRALKSFFLLLGVQNVQIIDLMKEAHPFINFISKKLYIKSTVTSHHGFDYYGWSYYVTSDLKPDGFINKCFDYLGKNKLKELIQQGRPDAIINTFPFGAACEIGRSLSIPTCTIITDYALHARWIHSGTNKYYVATEELKAELMAKKAVAAEQIKVTGIPIRSAFYETSADRNKFFPKPDPLKELVLVSAGSYGVLHHHQIEELTRLLLKKGNYQVAIVCGRNKKMEQKLKMLFADEPDVYVYGFVEQMNELMALASCIVTKAGGITLSESLIMKLPIFIYRPFGGQEKENARYFANKGIAHITYSIQELSEQIYSFLSNPAASEERKKRMTEMNKGDASKLIVKDVIQMVEEQVFVKIPNDRRDLHVERPSLGAGAVFGSDSYH